MTEAAVAFDIQRFSVHDGPGIRTTVFLKGCSLRCAWCQNPEALAIAPELAVYSDKCISCDECLDLCEPNALTVSNRRAVVDWSRCTNCLKCVDTCAPGALRRVGTEYDASKLVDACLADSPYYASSGGGVTLSGGEPVLQSQFLVSFLPELQAKSEEAIHVLLQTAGRYHWRLLEPLLPLLDAIYYDWKPTLAEDCKELIGFSDDAIESNLRQLLASSVPVTVRMPLVPGVNDSEPHLARAGQRLSALGVAEVILLAYHSMWSAKLERLNTTRRAPQVVGELDIERARTVLGQHGVTATFSD